MPYAIAIYRPDAPDAPEKSDYLKWYLWAKNNAPFTSATMGEWSDYVGQLNHPAISPQRLAMSTEGVLAADQIKMLLSYPVQAKGKIREVFEFAVKNGYPVSFTPTAETLLQYWAKSGS